MNKIGSGFFFAKQDQQFLEIIQNRGN